MSNYKVGDVASLFPSPVTKPGKNLQSLFNDYHNKNKSFGKMKKNIQQDSEQEVSSPASNKRKAENDLINENKQQPKKKTNKKTEKGGFVRTNKKTEKGGFVRTNKKKRESQSENENVNNTDLNIENETQDLFYYDSKPDFEIASEDDNIVQEPVKKQMSKKNSKKSKKPLPLETPEKKALNQDSTNEIKLDDSDLHCTLFVGNLPMSANKKMLHKMFRRFGTLKAVRLRGAIASKSGMSKKAAQITNNYHEGMQSLKGYVVYKDRDSAENALTLNGSLIGNHHIIVDFAQKPGEKKLYDDNSSIFIGNLPFSVDDETIWSAFESCGEIQAVRVIRDKTTGLGKGFGYVQFKSASAKSNALRMNDLEIDGRKIRVKSVEKNSPKKSAKESFQIIRSNVAMERSKEPNKKKSVKKMLKKGRREHKHKQIARMLGNKMKK